MKTDSVIIRNVDYQGVRSECVCVERLESERSLDQPLKMVQFGQRWNYPVDWRYPMQWSVFLFPAIWNNYFSSSDHHQPTALHWEPPIEMIKSHFSWESWQSRVRLRSLKWNDEERIISKWISCNCWIVKVFPAQYFIILIISVAVAILYSFFRRWPPEILIKLITRHQTQTSRTRSPTPIFSLLVSPAGRK